MVERRDYEPVTCDYHDQLEAAALRRREVEIEFALQGVTQRERGTIADVFAREGAEFVRFAADNGEVEIRLDEIITFREL